MGNGISAADRIENAAPDAIDRQLKLDRRNLKLRKERQILLLGMRESGKSTLVKQMKVTLQNGFTREELMTYRPTIYRNTLDSAQAVVLAMRKISLEWAHPNNCVDADRILDYRIEPSPSFDFSPDIAKSIHQLWKDPIIAKLMDHSSEFYLMDNAVYFFTNVLRIGSPDYLPTENDVLRAYQETMGFTEATFNMGQSQVLVLEAGVQGLDRKWCHCFENITSIIFCVALSEYDQVPLEGTNQNRMAESLVLFERVVNSRWFLRTSIILFFTKVDVFKFKLPKVPLKKYFPDYSGGSDVNKAAKYILLRFMQTNRARLSIYPHLTQIMNPKSIRLIFAVVNQTILNNALKLRTL